MSSYGEHGRPGGLFPRLQRLTIFFLATLLMVLVNLLFFRFDRAFLFRSAGRSLSPRATEMLSSVRENVRCTAILPRSNRFFLPLNDLLHRMGDAMFPAKLDVNMLDPHMDLSAAAEAAGRYSMAGWGVVFESTDGRVEKVPYDSLVEHVAKEPDSFGLTHPESLRFRGEQVCVTAVTRLLRPSAPVIYTLTGHGERDFSSYDALTGYSDLAREITREGYVLRPLLLGEAPFPEDCDLLVIAGPEFAPMAAESASIESYLTSGGRLLLLLNRSRTLPTGWEGILERVGLATANLTAIDQRTLGGYSLLVDRFSAHPIAHDLEKSAVYFVNPQVFEISSKASSSKTLFSYDIVAAAPDGSWGEVDPDLMPRRFDPGVDKRGFLPLAIAVEVPGGEVLGLKAMRAFVIGDAGFGSNTLLAGGRTANRDMLLNAINWLTENDLASAPSLQVEGDALRIAISRTRKIRYWFYSVICWPLAATLVGFLISSLRKLTA